MRNLGLPPTTSTDLVTRGWYEGRTARTALFIGDSYTQGYLASSNAARWSTLLSVRMNWNEQNYAVGGSGFTVGGEFNRNYLQQAQLANTNGVVPDVILVAGGRNDSTTNVVTAANTFIDYLRVTWPFARIVAIPGLWGAVVPSDDILNRYWDWITAFQAKNIEIIEYGWQWLFGHPDWVDADTVHPNDLGYAQITNYVYQGLTGHDTRPTTGRFKVTAGTGYTNTDCYGFLDGGIFHLFGGLTKSTSVAYLDTPVSLQAWLAPGVARFVPAFTNGGNNPDLLVKVNPPASATATSATLQISNTQGTLNTQLLFPELSWPVGG